MFLKNNYSIGALFVIIWTNMYYAMEKKTSLKKFAGQIVAYTDNKLDEDSYQIQNTSNVQYGFIEENPVILNAKFKEYIMLRLIKSDSGFNTKTLTLSKTYLKNNNFKLRKITFDEASELTLALEKCNAHFSHSILVTDPTKILKKILTDKKK